MGTGPQPDLHAVLEQGGPAAAPSGREEREEPVPTPVRRRGVEGSEQLRNGTQQKYDG